MYPSWMCPRLQPPSRTDAFLKEWGRALEVTALAPQVSDADHDARLPVTGGLAIGALDLMVEPLGLVEVALPRPDLP